MITVQYETKSPIRARSLNFVCYFQIASNRKTFRKLDSDNLEMTAMPVMLEKNDLHLTFR